MRHFIVAAMLLATFGSLLVNELPAKEPSGDANPAANANAEEGKKPPKNLPMATLGGKQLWGDVLHFHQWRIQRNALSKHYRLVDGHDIRRAWGDYQQCLDALNAIKQRKQLPPMQGKAVILMHGLFRTRASMKHMAAYLKKEGGYETFLVSYPSTRADIRQHAADLANVVAQLEGIEEIHFVGHSLGNIVVRRYLADFAKETGAKETGAKETGAKETGAKQNGEKASGSLPKTLPDPRIGRFVMLAPPNQGARMAQLLSRSVLFRTTVGKSGVELGPGWDEFQTAMATPACPFGIIAGGAGNSRGHNPLIAGDDDIIVGVKETRLAGAADFLVLPALHTTIMNDAKVQECTLRFLQTGCFLSEQERSPIPQPQPAEEISRQP